MSPPFPIPVGMLAASGATGGIVTDGLAVHLDAGDALSYAGSGLTWTDLITGTVFTLQPKFPGYPGPASATAPFYNASVGYFNFTSNNAAGTFGPVINPTRGAVEIWFRWRDTSTISSAVLLTGAGANWISLGNATVAHPDESIELNTGISAVMDDRQGHTHYRDGDWHQMVVVIDGAANLIYVDGVPVTTTFRSGNATSTGLMNLPATIVGKYTAAYQFDGDISIVRVYDTGVGSFSAADVAQNYAADSPRFAAFQPDNISGLTFWIDPSDANSVELSGADIVEVRDKALAIPTASAISQIGNEPTLASVDGINWMTFVGGSSQNQVMRKNSNGAYIVGADILGGGTDEWEIVMVMRPETPAVDNLSTYSNNGAFGDNGGYIGMYVRDPGLGSLRLMTYMWDAGDRHGDLSIASGTKIIFGQSKASGLQPWSLWNNGAQTVIGNQNSLGSITTPISFGRGYGVNYYTGLIGEVCIFDHELSVSDRSDLTAYLKAKWGTP